MKRKLERKEYLDERRKIRVCQNKKLALDQIDCYKSLFGIEIGEERQKQISEKLNIISSLIKELEPEESDYVQGLFAKYQNPQEKPLITKKIELFVDKISASEGDTFLASAQETLTRNPFSSICLIESIPAKIDKSCEENKKNAVSFFRMCQTIKNFESFDKDSPTIIQKLLESGAFFRKFCSLQNCKGIASKKDFDDAIKKFGSLESMKEEYLRYKAFSIQGSELNRFTKDYPSNKQSQAEEASRISSTSNSKTQESIFDDNQVNEASSSSNQTNQFNFGSTEQSPLISSSSNKTQEFVGDSSETSSGSERIIPSRSTSLRKSEEALNPFKKIFDSLSGGRKE